MLRLLRLWCVPSLEDVSDMHQILLAVGSNYNRSKSIASVKRLLLERFCDVRFSEELLTEPVGTTTTGEPYINFLVAGATEKGVEEVVAELKQLETLCGNTRSLRNEGNVVVDIDLMLYDTTRYHEADWKRGYIIELLEMFGYEQHILNTNNKD